MVNDAGKLDFNKVIPFEGKDDWDAIYADAECTAEILIGRPLASDPMVANLQQYNRSRVDVPAMRSESRAQLLGMLENYRATGFLHCGEFAREKWGTRTNAIRPVVELEIGLCTFQTAWTAPVPLILALSAKFPTETLYLDYADEDIGRNCGTMTFQAGKVIQESIAPSRSEMTKEDEQKWRAFAFEVTGESPDDYKEYYE